MKGDGDDAPSPGPPPPDGRVAGDGVAVLNSGVSHYAGADDECC